MGKTRVEGFTGCLQKIGPGVLSADEVEQICELIAKLLRDSYARQDRSPGGQAEGVDVDDMKEEMRLCNALCILPSTLMDHYADIFYQQCLHMFLPFVQQFVQPSMIKQKRTQAMLLANAMLEHLGQQLVQHWPTFLPAIV